MSVLTFTPDLILDCTFYSILLDIDTAQSEAKYMLTGNNDFYQSEIQEDQDGELYFIHWGMFGNSIFYVNQFSKL